ncbi:DUF998 domain-containing protein [Kocuria coralli]|uniref:DUF998 domain-containing protein n=1 Tax=Kocuria coralli TaxID=1461025 RepID=A0A5J5KWG9_9MICC|nr:DUF998 domain-containing protein [Kocuria coralli]KAA9393191.1 DUF998 domain-containing protein [Kocuria coralli]
MREDDPVARQARLVWAGWTCFLLGAIAGTAVLWGVARPLAGEGSIGVPAAIVTASVSAAAFTVSALRYRHGETEGMPLWQATVSHVSGVAVGAAVAGVSGLAVLCAGEILAVGLSGLQIAPLGGGLLTGAASAAGGSFAFASGIRLRTRDLAGLLFAFIVTGTLFAMLTAADPRWWELNFSQLGIDDANAWAFNGTLMVGGLLLATLGSYVGRDLHRLLGDQALRRIAWIVGLFAAAGLMLALVGVFPLHRAHLTHDIVASAALLLVVVAAAVTTTTLPGPIPAFRATTAGLAVGLVVAALLWLVFDIYSLTGFEAVVIGLVFVWVQALLGFLGALAPDESRPSARPRLLRHPGSRGA